MTCKYAVNRNCMLKKKNCNISVGIELYMCQIESCSNVLHIPCYVNMVKTCKEGMYPTLDSSKGLINLLFCGKVCYNKHLMEVKNKEKEKDAENKLKQWHCDGKEGGVHSMEVLMNWLTDEVNYSNYRGGKVAGTTDGKSKLTLCGDISNLIYEKGTSIFIIYYNKIPIH